MFKVAIVGTGNISPAHIEGLLAFPDLCQIVALCDIYPEKAERAKQKYRLNARVFDDHQKMLSAMPEIDIVHVLTPPYVHAEIAINAMNSGKHVLVEKPMAASLAECDAMLAAEAANHVTLGVIAQNRFRNPIYKLKQVIDSGKAGKIVCAHINSLWWRGHCYYNLWWRGTWAKEGGGPTLNHAVHHIDMLNWFMGELPEELTAMLANVMHDNSEVEDLSFTIARYPENAVAEICGSVVHHGEEQGIVLQCEKAKISAPWDVKAEISLENGFPQGGGNQALISELNHFYNALPDLAYEGHTGEIHDFLTALAEKRPPLITGKDGRMTLELITAIYKAGSRKEYVRLPLPEDDPFYTFEGILKNAVIFYEKSQSVENFDTDAITFSRL